MKLTMNLGARSYDIVIKRGALAHLSQLADVGRKLLIVTDDGVPRQYVQAVADQCASAHLLVLPQGEASKNPGAWQEILSRLLTLGFTRADAVAAVGGGVVGDVAGFAAATYMRGIDFYNLPTTVLAQVDSSIGGKVAIDLLGAKNVVGAFHQPSLVVIDPNVQATLPPRQVANGLAESVKMALTGVPELFELLESGDIAAEMERVLYLSLGYKKQIVEQDETEQGPRRLLNFGHTIGHAIESAAGLGTLLHGECVGLGLLPMLESKTLQSRTRAVLGRLGLPTACPLRAADILPHLQNDKKRAAGGYTIVRVKTLGEGYLEQVDYEELKLLVEEAYP